MTTQTTLSPGRGVARERGEREERERGKEMGERERGREKGRNEGRKEGAKKHTPP